MDLNNRKMKNPPPSPVIHPLAHRVNAVVKGSESLKSFPDQLIKFSKGVLLTRLPGDDSSCKIYYTIFSVLISPATVRAAPILLLLAYAARSSRLLLFFPPLFFYDFALWGWGFRPDKVSIALFHFRHFLITIIWQPPI